RPSFPDNVPRVIVRESGRRIIVNGAYRHGFLLAPMLASVTQNVIAGTLADHPLLIIE
ncbi:MAG: glycine oxidase, partial [Pseudomonadota bacterium]